MLTIALVTLAALIIGYSKTALGGLAVLAVALFATIMPTRESTAAILLLLIVGDVIACWHYRHDADWVLVRRLLPAVVPGIVVGTVFLRFVDDGQLRRSIGILLLVLVLLQLWLRSRGEGVSSSAHERPAVAWSAGIASGFATMTANSAGAVMTLYLSATGIDKRRFVGTNAWFFLVVNLAKVPFSVGLGLMHWADLTRALIYAPAILVGALVGYASVQRMSQRRFDVAVLAASALAALVLVVT